MQASNIEVLITLPSDDELPVKCSVSTTVEEERDPYGTGDSPTQYSVTITDCDPSHMMETAERFHDEISEKAVRDYKS
jgi:hypothetical protein